MQRRRLLVGLVALLIGCSTEPHGATGTVSFSYTGAGATTATTYAASGPLQLSPSGFTGSSSWASASTPSGELDILAAVPRTASTWDVAAITTFSSKITVGTYGIDSEVAGTSSSTLELNIATDINTLSTFTYACSLISGSVTIAAISSSRASGSFSGTGTCVTPAGAATAFIVTNGKFDVPITTP